MHLSLLATSTRSILSAGFFSKNSNKAARPVLVRCEPLEEWVLGFVTSSGPFVHKESWPTLMCRAASWETQFDILVSGS